MIVSPTLALIPILYKETKEDKIAMEEIFLGVGNNYFIWKYVYYDFVRYIIIQNNSTIYKKYRIHIIFLLRKYCH